MQPSQPHEPPTETLTVEGIDDEVVIERDAFGIPHVRARTLRDLFFGQGWATAADRTWQLEWDLRRAHGTLAAVTGDAAHAATDAFARRARLADVAARGYAALTRQQQVPLDAHAAGIEAHRRALAAGGEPPPELAELGIDPSPWRPEHAVAVFQIRHVLFATWQTKLWRARVLAALGPEAVARFNREGLGEETPVIVPPGARAAVGELQAASLFADPAVAAVLDALRPLGLDAAAPLRGSAEGPGLDLSGSNAWVLDGTRTSTGCPVLAGDPHRAYEVPNVYYQVRLSCPDEGIEAAGFSFPGVPGIQHFGQNGHVAWGVTNAMADYQDLYVERLPAATTDRRLEQVEVAGSAAIEVECLLTRHGPVIAGGTELGVGVALASTGIVDPAGSLRTLVPLLRAASIDELDHCLADWVEPLNNWVVAERAGGIGYRTTGTVPRRPTLAAWLPVPGWDERFDWDGVVDDAELPRLRDPGGGAVVTANQRITERGGAGPMLATDYAGASRAQRIWDRLGGAGAGDEAGVGGDGVDRPDRRTRHTPAAVAAIHGDAVSLAGLRFAARSGHRLLAGWDGQMAADSAPAALYATARDALVSRCCEQLADRLRANPFAAWEPPSTALPLEQRVSAALDGWLGSDDGVVLPGIDWDTELAAALAAAEASLARRFGPDPAGWRWGELHAVTPLHPLRGRLGGTVRPSSGPIAGGADCVMATNQVGGITTNALTGSVARYLWDLADPAASGWVVPLGASGVPGDAHFADQTERYVAVELVPVVSPPVRALRLSPGPSRP